MKNVLLKAIAMLVVFIFSTASSVYANSITNNNGNKQIVRVGYHDNGDVITNINFKGHEGLGYEIFKKIETISDLKFEFVKVEGSLTEALEKREIDITGLFVKTPERTDKYLYLDTPFTTQMAALATKGDKGIYYDDPQSINGKIVATYPGNPAQEMLDKYLKQHDISVTYATSTIDNYLKLDADFYLAFSGSALAYDAHTVLSLGMRYVYLISNHEYADTMAEINNTLHELIVTESTIFAELELKYLSRSGIAHRGLTRAEAEYLKGKTFTVSYVDNHKPYTYTDENGNANGAVIKLLDYIAQRHDFNVKYIPYNLDDDSYNQYGADILVSLIGTDMHTYLGFVDTEPYYQLQLSALADSSIVDESHVRTILNADTIGTMQYINVNFDAYAKQAPGIKFKMFSDFDNLLAAYESGDVQIALFTNAGIRYANAVLDGIDHTFAADFTMPTSFAINEKYANELVPIFNIIFDNIPTSKYYDILLGETAHYYPEHMFIDVVKKYWYMIVVPILAILLIFLWSSLIQYRMRQASVQKILEVDQETGGMSLYKFSELATSLLHDAKPNQYELITLDIDSFRTVNTYFNLSKGSEILALVTETLNYVFEGKKAIHTRAYSDVFYIIHEKHDNMSIETIAECILAPKLTSTVDTNFKLSLSVGTYTITDPMKELHIMINYTNVARQKGKNIAKTTIYDFNDKMQNTYETKLSVTYHMDSALLDKEFFLMYQPKIDINALQIVGAEALVRWRTTNGKMIFPDQFIPEFEQNGFINRLDTYVFEEVCQFIANNRGKIELPIISVNLSAITFFDEFIVDKLVSIAEAYSVSPKEIELEITESAMVTSEKQIIAKVNQFKSEGFAVSVDDFGAGVSSLNRLGTLDVDVLKMDKAFLDNVADDNNNSIVIESTIKLAKDLGMKVVAEGVETAEQAIWLRSLGCDIAQGYYFERPVESKIFEEILLSSKTYVLDEAQENIINISVAK